MGKDQNDNSVSHIPVMPESEDGRIGLKVGNLQLCARIGYGGMGAVYLARHRLLERSFAVKVLHPRFSEDPNEVNRFRKEAIATARLRHPNIVFVTDFGFDERLGLYLVMEHLEGQSLAAVLKTSGQMPLGRCLHIIRQVAEAIKSAHGLEISHRDLKPENIILLTEHGQQDEVKVLDFGIAALKSEDHPHQPETVIGTPETMAPEQLTETRQDQPKLTDIYALGMLLYQMATGRPVFVEDTLEALIKAQLWDTAPLLSDSLPELSGSELEQLVATCLLKSPKARPQSASAFLDWIDRAQVELEQQGATGIDYDPKCPDEISKPSQGELLTHSASSNRNTIRMTAVLNQIRILAPTSAAGMLLDGIPMIGNLRGEALCGALWGVIQQELMIHEIDDPEFELGCDQLVLLIQAILDSETGDQKNRTQTKIFRVMKATLPALGETKHHRVISVLSSLSVHPNFPHDWLSHTGSWEALKKFMTTELQLPWTRRNPISLPASDVSATDEIPLTMTLMDKLSQEVSLKNIGMVLNHEIHIFGGKSEEH